MMLASGVLSSCETMLTSSDFSRSLCRSCSFWVSSSRLLCSSERAIALNERDRSRISAAPTSGSRVERSPAATRLAPAAAVRTGRAMPRARKIPKRSSRPPVATSAPTPTSTARAASLRAALELSVASRSSLACSRASPFRIASIRTTPSRVATGARATSGLTRAIAISGRPYSLT